jgi:hypothetical protein
MTCSSESLTPYQHRINHWHQQATCMACREQINGNASASPIRMSASSRYWANQSGSLQTKAMLQRRIICTAHGPAWLIASAQLLTRQASLISSNTGLQTRRITHPDALTHNTTLYSPTTIHTSNPQPIMHPQLTHGWSDSSCTPSCCMHQQQPQQPRATAIAAPEVISQGSCCLLLLLLLLLHLTTVHHAAAASSLRGDTPPQLHDCR